MIKSGKFVAQFINDGSIDDEQIQPNGVDLTIGKIYGINDLPAIYEGNMTYDERWVVEPNLEFYELNHEPYIIEYGEKIKIPEDIVGHVYPRSRIIRSGCWLTTALWDSGYEGIGEGTLIPFHPNGVMIQKDMRVAQMVFRDAKTEESYDGTHQHERINNETNVSEDDE